MTKDKKWFILFEIVMAVMVIVLAFIMLWEKNKENLDKVSVIVQNSDDNQWAAFRYGLKMAAKEQGIELVVVSTGEMLTAEEQKSVIDQEIENGADAIIVEPVLAEDTEKMLKKTERKVPVMLVEYSASQDRDASELAVTEPDHTAMGTELANELLKDFEGKLNGKTLGIVVSTQNSEAAANREKAFRDTLADSGADILWSVALEGTEDPARFLEAKPGVDIVVALDNKSLIKAGECAAARNLHGALVYGIGNSTEAVYYLDTDYVECLVVPDEFHVGYQSMTETAEELRHYFHRMQSKTVSYTVLRRETLFSEENQNLLYTMSQ